MTPSPKAQAEAMASEIICGYERRHEQIYHAAELSAIISTTLEKLLTENEGNKRNYFYYLEQFKRVRSKVMAAYAERDVLQSQLTATESKLETAKQGIENAIVLITEHHSSQVMRREHVVCPCCDNGRIEKIYAFLSTLTAAKKESE